MKMSKKTLFKKFNHPFSMWSPSFSLSIFSEKFAVSYES